jgi:hypothetical protein
MTITNKVSLKSVMAGVTPIADVPDAPVIGAVTNVGTGRAYNNGSATIAYTSALTGGLPTTFTATSTPGSLTATGVSPITITGLQSSIQYTYTVRATNATGSSALSATSAGVTATTVPQAPTIGTASVGASGSGQVTVPYTAGSTGGSAITTFTATSSPGGLTGTGSSPITVSGLTLGTAYTFAVTATNANGTSTASSASNSVTPTDGYWFVSVKDGRTDAGSGDILSGTGVDSLGNVYATGNQANASNGYEIILIKTNASGTVAWQKVISNTSLAAGDRRDTASSLSVDSSGNSYIGGLTTADGTIYYATIIKVDTNGSITWQKIVGSTENSDHGIKGVFVDGSGNVYATGQLPQGGANDAFVTKLNSSGTKQWTRRISGPLATGSRSEVGTSVTADSSGNVYAVGRYRSSAGPYETYVIKYDSSGTVVWKRNLADYNLASQRYDYGQGIAVDSSSNVYVSGRYKVQGSTTYMCLIKYNSSGTLQWKRQLGDATDVGAISTDPSGNIYIGTSYYSSGYYGLLAKYDSTGAIQWQRVLEDGGNKSVIVFDIKATASAVLVASRMANTSNGFVGFLGKIPLDGTKTGTYTMVSGYSMTLAASSKTEGNATNLNDTAGVVTEGASAATDGTSSTSSNTGSLTISKATL